MLTLIRLSQQKLQKYSRAVITVRGRIPESKKFAGIQNSVRIERLFEPTMKITRHLSRRFRPPPFFCQTDSVFACDHAVPRQHLCKKIVERALDLFAHSSVPIILVCHDVDVNVSVSGVAKTGNRKTGSRGKFLGKRNQIDQAASGNDNILI